METISENWSVLENNYFIKYHFFNMAWGINDTFKDYLIAYEPNGGSIAIMLKAKSGQELTVYSSSGKLISKKMWPDKFVIGLYWSENENVLLLQDSGRVAIYTLQCEYVSYVSMGDAVKDSLVKSFRFFPSLQGVGLMVITEKNECYFKMNVSNVDAIIKNMKSFKKVLFDTITDWIVFTDLSDREVVALFACGNELIKVKYNAELQVFGEGCRWFSRSAVINKLSVSMSQASLAMAMTDGRILLLKSDLSQPIVESHFEFRLGESQASVQMEWAGENMLVMYWEQSLYLVDVDSQATSVFYLDEPLLFPEIDGVRLITPSKHEFIQKVPQELEQLCELGGDCPAAWLFDAQRHLDSRSSDAINYLEQVLRRDGQLERAIDVCVEAAAHCLEPKWQKTILHAVRLGRSYLPHYKSERVAEVHAKLRLLNNLKLPFVAVPLTMNQLEQLTVPVLLDRLCNRRLYPFLERACRELRVPREAGLGRMLEYWAESQVRRTDLEEPQLAARLCQRLADHPGFNYARVAEVAADLNKNVLAEALLEREVRVEHQVRVWLRLQKGALALARAVESGNCDLVAGVVARLERALPGDAFFLLVCKQPVAKTVYLEQLLMAGSPDWSRSKRAFDDLDDTKAGRAEAALRATLSAETPQSALAAIASAQDLYKGLGNDFMVQALEDQRAVVQAARDAGIVEGLPPTSARDLLALLMDRGLEDRAEALRQRLKVPERQSQWLRARSLAQAGRWADLERLEARWGRRPPVTPAEVAALAVEAGCSDEAVLGRLLGRLEQPRARVRLLVALGRLKEAEDAARAAQDDYLVHYVAAMRFTLG